MAHLSLDDRRNFAALLPIFEGAVSGHYTLPDDLVAAKAVADRLNVLLAARPPRQPFADVMNRAALTLADAARTGKAKAPDFEDDIVRALTVTQAESSLADIDRRAALMVMSDVEVAAIDLAPTIHADHLQPAFADLLEQLQTTVDAFADYVDASADTMLAAPDKARLAYLSMPDLAVRYSAIWKAAGTVRTLTRQTVRFDDYGEFLEMRNLAELYPMWRRTEDRPWPGETHRKLAWLIAHGAQLWLPTAEQQDELWMAHHGDAYEKMRRSRQNAMAVHVWGGDVA